MTEPNPDQILRLPKWAQDYITHLQRRHDEAQAHAREALDQQTPSKLCFDEYDNPKYVQSNRVTFLLNGHARIEVAIEERENCLKVYSKGHPCALTVRPQSTNVVTIRTEDL